MSTFQIVITVWLTVVTIGAVVGLCLLLSLLLATIKRHNALEDRIKDLEQTQRGNPFAEEGLPRST